MGRPLKRFLSILSDLIFDSRVDPWHPQSGGRTRYPHTLLPHSRRADSMISFSWEASSLKRQTESSSAGGGGLPRKPTLIDGKISGVIYDDGALDHILQFTNIAWPCICLQ